MVVCVLCVSACEGMIEGLSVLPEAETQTLPVGALRVSLWLKKAVHGVRGAGGGAPVPSGGMRSHVRPFLRGGHVTRGSDASPRSQLPMPK